jgi:hypothetical protein
VSGPALPTELGARMIPAAFHLLLQTSITSIFGCLWLIWIREYHKNYRVESNASYCWFQLCKQWHISRLVCVSRHEVYACGRIYIFQGWVSLLSSANHHRKTSPMLNNNQLIAFFFFFFFLETCFEALKVLGL